MLRTMVERCGGCRAGAAAAGARSTSSRAVTDDGRERGAEGVRVVLSADAVRWVQV